MSISTRFNFDEASDWTFDSSKIEITGNGPGQYDKDLEGLTFTEDFSDTSRLTYNTTYIQHNVDKMEQKNQRIANAIFGATFSVDENASWGDGTLTGTLANGAVITNGKLDMTAGSSATATYTGTGNLGSSTGCIRFKYTPKFTGSVTSNEYLLDTTSGAGRTYILLLPTGDIRFSITNDAGGTCFLQSASKSWVADQEYEIEINWDIPGSSASLYIDGTRIMDVTTVLGTKTTVPANLYIGCQAGGFATNGLIDDFVSFNIVKHTGASYTPGYTLPNYDYEESNVDITLSYTGYGEIQNFSSLYVTATNSPKYTIDGKYWTGSAWAASNGSYAQASSRNDIDNNLSALTGTFGTSVIVSTIFQGSNTQSDISNLEVGYTGQELAYPVATLLKISDVGNNFIEDFADDTDFTYDSSLLEFSGGQLQQINNRPIDAIFGVTYTTNQNANFGEAALTGVLANGAVVSNGRLDITASNANCAYTGNANNPTNEGCIRIKYTPDTTSPTGYIFASSGSNQFYLVHSSGRLRFIVKNDAGGSGVDVQSSSLTWVSGQTYEIEVNWNISGSIGNIYRDGTRIANETSFSGVRTTTGSELYIGSYNGGVSGTTGYIEDLVIFDAVQHSGTSYTPGYTLPEADYLAASATLPEMEYTGIGTIVEATDFTTTESGTPKYIVQIDRSENYLYHNGSAWVTSDETYTQANLASEVANNISDLPIDGEKIVQFKILFTDAQSVNFVSNLNLEFTGQAYPTDEPVIESNTGVFTDTFLETTGAITEPSGANIGWVMKNAAGEYKYHNGTAWVTSDQSYAQSNTIAEVNANLNDIIPYVEETIYPVAVLSSNGTANPEVRYIQIVHQYYESEASPEINECAIHFYVEDLLGDNYTEATLKVSSKKAFWHSERLILPFEQSAEVNDNGHVTLSVIETTSVNKYLNFSLEYTDLEGTSKTIKFKKVLVPNQTEVDGQDLLEI